MATSGTDWSTWPPWYKWTLNNLCRLVRDHGGSIWVSQVQELYQEDARHQNVFHYCGGLRSFCMWYSDRLKWVHGRSSAFDQIVLEAGGNRVPRLAGAFAGSLPENFEGPFVSKDQLAEAWTSFCEQEGEASGGFGRALFLLVRWRVLARAGMKRFRLLGSTTSGYARRAPARTEGALSGQKPPLMDANWASPVGPYPLPDEFFRLLSLDVRAMQDAVRRLLREEMGLTPNSIDSSNFCTYQHAVLFTEEVQMKYDMALYDLEETERLQYSGGLHEIFVPGLAEKRPSVLRGDRVFLTCRQNRFLGYVHQVLLDKIKVSFHGDFRNQPPFVIHFDFNRTPLRVMHRAVDELTGSLMATTSISHSPPVRHEELNEEQRRFMTAALRTASERQEPPLLLWGPPGTGKTTTLVHTIVAILRQQRSAKILVTAPSNSASDWLCEMLARKGVQQSEMLRLVALMRDHRSVAAAALDFTRTDPVTGCFKVPALEELRQHRVVVATCTCAAYLRSRASSLAQCWFSHVFVDEAAQAMEAEVLVPLTLRKDKGQIFLVGDFKQLGPVVRSPVSISFGLGVPLMERIVQAMGTSHSRMVALLDTYRAHPSILKLYNKTIYGDMLRCKSPSSSRNMESWPDCPRDANGSKHPIIFHHCNGQEARNKNSPSWQNVEEGNVVRAYLGKLLAHGVEAKDIGIISPYHQQCQRLRNICLGESMDVEVGTTEVFQGREKRVIIISTVRSRQQDALTSDFRFALGFLGNYKRTNVALSRARSLLVVVGNMELLSNDATWHNVIKLARDMGCLRGEAFNLSEPRYGENSEWAGQAGLQTGMENGFDGAVDRPWRDNF